MRTVAPARTIMLTVLSAAISRPAMMWLALVLSSRLKVSIGNGKEVTDRLPKLDDKYDTAALSQKLKLLKDQNPGKRDVILLVEPEIGYSSMIGVMDALKFVLVRGPREGSQKLRIALFPNVTVGDAP